jgi:PEP-CTERM motif
VKAKLTSLAATIAIVSASPVEATQIQGSFEGIIYNASGSIVNIPINGTFDYDTTSYAYECLPSQCSYQSIFAPTTSSAMRITETSALGTLAFDDADGSAIALEAFQINFASGQTGTSSYSEIDVIFPDNIFNLGEIPTSFSADLAPYQGSSETYYNNGAAYDFYVTHIEASPVPEPPTWAMLLLGFAGLGFAGYRWRGAFARG